MLQQTNPALSSNDLSCRNWPEAAWPCWTQYQQRVSPLQDEEGTGRDQSEDITADAQTTDRDAVLKTAAEVMLNLFLPDAPA